MDDNNQSGYNFIRETIKEPPINKRKALLRVIMVIVCALIFGLVSAVVFIYTVKNFMPQPESDTAFVNIPRDEENLSVSEEEIPEEEEVVVSANTVSFNETEEEEPDPEPAEVEVSADNSEPERRTSVSVSYVTERVSLSVEDYKALYSKLKRVATEVSRSVVTVTAIVNDTDWFDNLYESSDYVSGVVVANNGKDLLILSEEPDVEGDMKLNITFNDGVTLPGEVKSTDANTGLVVISVPLDSIPDDTKEAIREAALGSSKGVNIVGMPVMALGSPLGIQGSQCFGRTTSNQRELFMSDRNVHVLSTDIYGSENATGVITNYDGLILGIISQKTALEDAPNLLSAYAISDIKDIIEKLSNGSSETYLGIYGMDVTDQISSEEGVPKGFYVTKVQLDSPAMKSGIQSGDVIVKFGTADITCSRDYTDEMMKYQPGEESVITVQRYSKGEFQEMTFDVAFDDAADHFDDL